MLLSGATVWNYTQKVYFVGVIVLRIPAITTGVEPLLELMGLKVPAVVAVLKK